MKYTPLAITTADKAIAQKHDIGGMKKLYASSESSVDLGTIFLAGDASGVWTPHPINTPPTAGADLAIAVDLQLTSPAAAVVTLNVTFDDNSSGTATATFAPPTWVGNQSFDFQHGAALDLTASSAGRTIKAITGLASVTNALRFSQFRVYQLPSANSWKYIDTVEEVNPSISAVEPVSIPDGLNPSADVVGGRPEVHRVEVRALHRSIVDGLARFGSRNVCLRLDVLKSGVVLAERHTFGNCIIRVNPTFGDGNDTVKQAGEGQLSHYCGFFAP